MKKFFILTIITSTISFILLFFFGDFIIKKSFESILSNGLNREVKIKNFDVGYFSEEIKIEKIEISNKDFPGKLLVVENAFFKLKALSFYEKNIIIEKIVLDGVNINYFFDITNRSRSNFTSLKRRFEGNKSPGKKTNDTDKKFLIKQLDIKNINVSANSSELNLNQKVKLSDMKFNNLGNSEESQDYKVLLRETIDNAYDEIKGKIASGNINQNVIKDQIKDKLKNKLKKLF